MSVALFLLRERFKGESKWRFYFDVLPQEPIQLYSGFERETKHLEAIEGEDSRLCLFQIDLLDYDSIAAAVGSVASVFHLASPCTTIESKILREIEREQQDDVGGFGVEAKEASVKEVVKLLPLPELLQSIASIKADYIARQQVFLLR